jgi:hypothetical protein
MGHFHQLRLLLWKNSILKQRRLGSTCCELLIPIIGIIILIIIRMVVKIENVDMEIIEQSRLVN